MIADDWVASAVKITYEDEGIKTWWDPLSPSPRHFKTICVSRIKTDHDYYQEYAVIVPDGGSLKMLRAWYWGHENGFHQLFKKKGIHLLTCQHYYDDVSDLSLTHCPSPNLGFLLVSSQS